MDGVALRASDTKRETIFYLKPKKTPTDRLDLPAFLACWEADATLKMLGGVRGIVFRDAFLFCDFFVEASLHALDGENDDQANEKIKSNPKKGR